MKIISWNINGIRACIKKGLVDYLDSESADIICFQEIKACPDKIPSEIHNMNEYQVIVNSAERKGYSGTMILTKVKPQKITYGIEGHENLKEGRVITLEFEKFFLINVYTPNSKQYLLRLDFRQEWDKDFYKHINNLNKVKPAIITGDLNVAHKEIDLANPKSNLRNPGFTIEERNGFQEYIDNEFIDCFRLFNKEPNNYTWWSYRTNARARNVGWRIDYFLAAKELVNQIKNCEIKSEILGSDHCPITLNIEI